ncbi:MAG: UDP-N-acetylmuramyl-tripeptide synthetase [Planctomycetaceae bacterium]|jgi:UDP-N-acetylmuramoyl-L-alanyl-D-glutamate--2,6-diaminopimelate ligase|nr:UDP-N-acetylmuramyl-tripeptide synthetase [Planctomycetaceae bacterium]
MRCCCIGTESVSLKKVLKRVCKDVECSFGTSVKIKGCTADPDEVRPGDAFFALPDEQPDSDDLINEAVNLAVHHGCSAICCPPSVARRFLPDVPVFVVPNVAEAYAAVCQALCDEPARSLKMIAVTGTSGKTSTSYLISGVLAESGLQVGLIGSLGIFDGDRLHPLTETDLLPHQLAYRLNQMVLNGCTHAIVEVSSKMIAEGVLGGIGFDAVCITNIRRDHLDYHKTVEQYRRSKLSIFRYAKKHALAVCNIDDRITEAVVPLINQPMLSVGIRNQAEVGSVLVERCPSEQTFIVTAGTEAVPFRTKMIGDDHMYNCLTAAALGIGLEIDIKTVARGIERVESVPGRMERIECGQDFNVYIDSARTADSLAAVLKTVREITQGRMICVFGAAVYHEPAKRSALAKTLETFSDSVILTSVSDRTDTKSAAAICDIGHGFSAKESVKIMPDRAEAIAWGLSEAKTGDSVLIFGHGTPEETMMTGGYVPFCDRLFTKQWLYENQSVPA